MYLSKVFPKIDHKCPCRVDVDLLVVTFAIYIHMRSVQNYNRFLVYLSSIDLLKSKI